VNSLLLSFPGTPIIYYGDEIGMGDNIYLGDRNGVRTPMQWTPDRNGGFSRCDPARLFLPTIMDPVYGYEAVNVEAQSRNIASLLSWTKRLIAVRKSSQVFGRGSLAFIRTRNRSVMVYARQYENEVILCVANLSRSAQATEIDLSPWRGRSPLEMLGRRNFPPIGEQPYVVTLAPYGFFWFYLCEQSGEIESPSIAPEFETLVVTEGWRSLAHGRARVILERDVLPSFLASRRWFPAKNSAAVTAKLAAAIPLTGGELGLALALIETKSGRDTGQYLMPLAINWTRFDRARNDPNALAAVRRGPREGTLLDATADAAFISMLLAKVRAASTLEIEAARLEFSPVGEFAKSDPPAIEDVRAVDTEQSNTTVLVGSHYAVKLFRRIEPGINPEIEVGRFLTEVAGFANMPSLLGTVEMVEGETRRAVAVIHRFIENQGDAWSVTNAYLDRYVEERRLLSGEAPTESDEQPAYLLRMRQVGRRVAEMQLALASRDDVPDFRPEPITPADVGKWTEEVLRHGQRAFGKLARHRANAKDADRALIDEILAYETSLPAYLRGLLPESIDAMKIRHHGDFHLGQMLIVKDDVVILDFEGEPRRSLAERRRKAAAARDVAGLIRSIDYSATAALERALKSAPDEHGTIARSLEDWRERSVTAMLAAYREFMVDARLWPAQADDVDRLLDFFLLEKACHELEYEMVHRPDWLRVPLTGMARIISRSAQVSW
jgi:maltose alpha-D-glucosyltransferase/alpha-amylase